MRRAEFSVETASFPEAVFVTGTDTGVGKTVVSAIVVAGALAEGRSVGYLKPAQTGVNKSNRGDTAFVAAAAAALTPPARHECRCVYELAEPLAPAMAATLSGVVLEIDNVTDAFYEMKAQFDLIVVEGAGGLLVPFSPGVLMADLAHRMGSPILVVARPGLGTLNHTRLTVEAARSRKIEVAGLVISGWPDQPNRAEESNLDAIASFADAPLLGLIPEVGWIETEGAGVAASGARLAMAVVGRDQL